MASCEGAVYSDGSGYGTMNFFVPMGSTGVVFSPTMLCLTSNSPSWPEQNSRQGGIRPIVYLKTDLMTMGKDANGAWIISE